MKELDANNKPNGKIHTDVYKKIFGNLYGVYTALGVHSYCARSVLYDHTKVSSLYHIEVRHYK